jgi:hypothetical protein
VVAGIDLVRDSASGEFFVLEDNVRTPSGVSYVLENRLVMTRMFPRAFQRQEVLPIDDYPAELCQVLRAISPRAADPVIVTLTRGRSGHRHVDARCPQQRLFRAQLPGSTDGRRMQDDFDEHFDFLAPTAYVPHPPALQSLIDAAELDSASSLVGFGLKPSSVIRDGFRYEKGLRVQLPGACLRGW